MTQLSDGSMYTLLSPHLREAQLDSVDELCLSQPVRVIDCHRAFIEAGASRIHTPTLRVAWRDRDLERRDRYRAALECAHIAIDQSADSNPISIVATVGSSRAHARAYWYDLELLLDEGVREVACPTNTSITNMTAFADAWHEVADGTGAIATLSASVGADGSPELLASLEKLAEERFLRIGITCCAGPNKSLRPILDRLAQRCEELHFAPSAGLPNDDGTYPWEADRWAEAVAGIIEGMPVSTVGGCCGATPDHIAALAKSAQI